MGIGGVPGVGGRAEGAARVVEELVEEAGHGLGDGRALGVGQVGPGEEEAVELAADRGLGAVAELAEQGPGGPAVSQGGEACGRLALDERPGLLEPLATIREVPLDLAAEVVEVVEHHLLQLADPGVEVARDGDVDDQEWAVAARPLDAGEAVEGHDRLGGGGGADDDVGLGQGVVERVEADDAALAASATAQARAGSRLATRIAPGARPGGAGGPAPPSCRRR